MNHAPQGQGEPGGLIQQQTRVTTLKRDPSTGRRVWQGRFRKGGDIEELPPRKVGRPKDYREGFCQMVEEYCMAGHTDEQIAKFLGIDFCHLYEWKRTIPEFAQAFANGREGAINKVARSMYQRAMGYKHPSVKIFCDSKTGQVTEVPYEEHYPPDTKAGIFLLTNRMPGAWKDRSSQEVTGADGQPLVPPQLVILPASARKKDQPK